MAGVVSYGAYIPKNRLSRDELARAWGGSCLKGERSVAHHDEDSITMAAAAAMDCLKGMDPQSVDALFFASTSSPYTEKQAASIIARVLGLRRDIFTADYSGSLRAGTSALRTALDAVKSGSARNVLVVAADCRLGAPRSTDEQAFGDGAGAFLVEADSVAVEVEDVYSLSQEITDVWRTREDRFVRNWEDRWVIMHGYDAPVREAVTGLMKKNNLEIRDITRAVLAGPNPRSQQALARSLKLDPEKQVQDLLFGSVGNTGAAQPLMLLAAALEEAGEGDRLLMASYGDGSDAFLLKVTKPMNSLNGQRGITGHLNSKRSLDRYEQYVRYRGLMESDAEEAVRKSMRSSATVLWRTGNSVLSLHGSKCKVCATTTFPVQRVCNGCQAKDQYEEVRLTDEKGKVYTFSLDNLAGGVEPPTPMTVIETESGARIYCEMTEAAPEELKIDMPVEMTFRRVHQGAGFINYFWKSRPVR
jgi:3-hydroxy-3-methylglutaryl CoA synthase